MKGKILVIEDQELYSNILRQSLENKGCKVLVARNGREGYEVAIREHPDLIVLDIIMPLLDGERFMEVLRQDEWGKKVKVIILTNKVLDEESMNKLMSTSPSYYLQKVDNPLEEVIEKIEGVLKV